jgi:hypothetical protein
MGVVVVLVLVLFVGWMIFVQSHARKQSSFHTSQGRTAVQQAIDEVFGQTWTRVKGPGHINVKPKLRAHAPTISIDVSPGGQGGSDVDIWRSAWGSRYGVSAHAQLVWRKERQLANRLGGIVGQSGTAPVRGTTPTGVARAPKPTTSTPSTSAKPKVWDGTGAGLAAKRNGVQGGEANAQSQSALVCRVVSESDYSFIVRTTKTPREIVAAVQRSLTGVQQGSMNHLLFGPPRATMWAYILESKKSGNILTISLVTKDNPDRQYVDQSVQVPLRELIVKEIDGQLEIRSARDPLGVLQSELLGARLVPVAEYSN